MQASVDDQRVVVPAAVAGPVVVSFDQRYIWSFAPERDGIRKSGAWLVAWPEALQRRLQGTARVTLSDTEGTETYFDEQVSFGASTEPLSFRDPQGHPLAIDKMGHLTRVFSETDPSVRAEVIAGTVKALDDLRNKIGIDAHISYGCLLGAVRDGKMIGHDSDADLAYLSDYTHPADIILESYRMERELRALGWQLVRMSGADLKLFWPLTDGRNVQIDIFGAFHVEGVFYQLGGRSGTLPASALSPASTVTLEGFELAAPADPEQVLAFLYGPSWRVPDPSFDPVEPADGMRRLDGWLRGVRTHVTDWNEILMQRRTELPRGGSTFAASSLAEFPEDSLVVDIGSGNGRDALWFHQQGRRVRALDFAGAALRQSARRLKAAGADPDVRVLSLNDLRFVLTTGAELARESDPQLYGRGLLNSIDVPARSNLWRMASMSLRRAGTLHLEFSAARDDLAEQPGPEPIWRVSVDEVVAEIEASGGVVRHREVGPGHDFFDQPDPHVARLRATWTRPTDKDAP